MFNFFLPRKSREVLSEAELLHASLSRNRIQAQDILAPRDLEALTALEEKYPDLLKRKDIEGLEKLNKETKRLGNRLFPSSAWDGWSENVEVFVVAAIMALAIRTFFLQPFQIPTGSMEPTLYGIEPIVSTEKPPGYLQRAWDFAIHGRSYSRVVTEHGGTVTGLTPGTFTIWFDYTDVHLVDAQGKEEVDRIWIRASDVVMKLNVLEGLQFKPGDVLANYVTQTGDKVLVDKVTYNFRPPQRGEVFIFTTAGIEGLKNERHGQEGSEDFIKRCVGLAGDRIKIQPPLLYINDKLAEGSPAYEKEFKRTDHYPGYSLLDSTTGTEDYYVPTDCYWAMGDNSPNSKDSRYWGGVPRQNLIGRGYFVFWPFTERWGWIK